MKSFLSAVPVRQSVRYATRTSLSHYHSQANMSSQNIMQASNRLKAAFDEGRQSLGVWQMLPGANLSRTLARSGVDWVVLDCEHGNIDGE